MVEALIYPCKSFLCGDERAVTVLQNKYRHSSPRIIQWTACCLDDADSFYFAFLTNVIVLARLISSRVGDMGFS